jgi:hypothetical protein
MAAHSRSHTAREVLTRRSVADAPPDATSQSEDVDCCAGMATLASHIITSSHHRTAT